MEKMIMNARFIVRAMLFLFVMVLIGAGRCHAADNETILILNSFNENEPWVNSMTQPLILGMANRPEVSCEIINLNNVLIADSTDFHNLANGLIYQYRDQKPEYIVIFGLLAFNLRDYIKQAWGDVPILLISNVNEYVTNEEFFGNDIKADDPSNKHSLSSIRDKYNFTAIIIPAFYEETIEMMVELVPKMDNFVFMSDSVYLNRLLAQNIQQYLKYEYPEIRFTWLKASEANAEAFQRNLVTPQPQTGFLLSSWLYEKTSVNGIKIPRSSDLKLVSGSHNPIFSLDESYITSGVIGGVYASHELAQRRELEVIDSMIAGKSMRNIPIFVCEQSYPSINYRRLIEYGLSEANCPEGTVFFGKPSTFLEKYLWPMLVLVLLVGIIITVMTKKNRDQRKKIKVLKRNQEFVNNMPIPYSTATVRYDTDNQIVTMAYTVKNEAFEKILRENVVDGSPFQLFPPQFIVPKVKELLSTNRYQNFVYHFQPSDTYYEFLFCLVNSDPMAKEKSSKRIDVFAVDVTKTHKNEEELKKTTRKLSLTIGVTQIIPWEYSVPTNMITYDSNTIESKVNFGVDKAIFKPKTLEEFVSDVYAEDREKVLQLRKDLREGISRPFKILYRRYVDDKKDKMLWFELNGLVTEFDEQGRPLTVTGSSQNVNERIMHQQEMAAALERANESDRMKSAFLASMSHEIRTPLNAIVGFSNVIAHTDDEQERLEFCDIINKNNDQLLSLINDVLDLAKIESNAIDINYEECDVNSLLDQVEKTMSMRVPQGVKLNVLQGRKNCIAELDHNRVTQILNNFITNACKFTVQGSITLGYDVTDSGMLYFYVRDTGIGISAENQKKVFDRFFKLDAFVPGTGLGLSICRNLVEKMGGEIGVESMGEGHGSLFWFTIPYIPVAGAVDHTDDNVFFKKVLPELNRQIKVLIAEDNEGNYRLLAHLLKDGFQLIRAHNGMEAVDLTLTKRPDVILMDISMPGMDGYQAFSEIRKLSSKVPVIAVTAYVHASERTKVMDYGFDGFVSKPITQKAILDAIGHALT